MGNSGAEGYESPFPALNGSLLASGSSCGVRVSPSLGDGRVDLIEILEKSTVPNDDHLLVMDTDGPAAKQIMELSAEVNMLRRELMAKGYPSKPSPAAPSSTTIAGTTISPTGKLPSPTPWKDMVAAESPIISHMNLHYCPPTVVNDKLCVNIPEGVAASGVDRWKDWIVGYFVDRKLSCTAVSTITQNLWGIDRQVVEAGPCHFGGKLMVLQQWQPQMNLVKEQLAKLPVWAHFYYVPLELWTEEGPSHVASAIGRPLYADHFIESCKRISYAKICVEIDTSSALPDSFDLILPSGAIFNIRVWYPWRPLRCESCKVFGHKTCQSKAVPMTSKPQVWVVKPTHVAPIVAEVLSPIVNDVVGVAALASSVSVSLVADGAVERIPTVVDIKKKAGIDGAASLKMLDSLVSSSGTKTVNSFSVLQNSDSGEDMPTSGAEPITLPTEEFTDGLNQELILQASPPKKKGRGRSKGVQKPVQAVVKGFVGPPGKGRGDKASSF
ncbi:hypothetical protein RHMOL_Rhmol12G0217800 [Rhododendron molle]|uniref:Uncharacterized protein n=1 Tax=Rhododendron molle TaxID=49168 RepID=A0ACC0LL88_RHOML|nr:hypothetical protein RHMOL_Rhmol12G0217800 [Rhododendron molle]